jgi:uncharacterized membrane protein
VDVTTSAAPPLSLIVLAAIFVVAGALHFVIPNAYARIMPPWLPAHIPLVYASGVFEILGGVGILIPAVRVAAGWGLIALLIAVFPANIQMLQTAIAQGQSLPWRLALIARLPLQPLLMFWVYQSAVRVAR